MWYIIQKIQPIWFFDGTGTINKKLPSQKDPHFFSMVCHDKKRRQLVPVFEFVSTDQHDNTLSIYLQRAISIMEKTQTISKRLFLIAPIVVVDFSWAMINSVNDAFNKRTTLQYLNWTFEILINKRTCPEFLKIMKTRVYICATHFLKTIIKKVKKFQDKKKNILFKMFVYSFTLIQNSVNIDLMIAYLKAVHNVFCNPYLDVTVVYSINIIKDELKTRGLNTLNASQYLVDIDETKLELSKKQPNSNIFWFKDISNEPEDSKLIEDSPYSAYFKNLMFIYDQEIVMVPNEKIKKNPYFKKELFDVIKKVLYLAPFWTGIMIEQCRQQHILFFRSSISRLTNNPVENYFGHLKKNILTNLKNLLTSELASHLYLRLKAKFVEFYQRKFTSGKPRMVKRLKDNNKPKAFSNKSKKELKKKKPSVHTWLKNVKRTRVKGIYMEAIQDFGNFNLKRTDNIIETADFVETFDLNSNFENSTEHKNNAEMKDLSDSDQMDYTTDLKKNDHESKKYEMPINVENREYENIDQKYKYYYLKFINEKNGCFANSVIQLLLCLGKDFFDQLNTLPIDFPVNDKTTNEISKEFWTELRGFFCKYFNYSDQALSSLNFRKLVDTISNIYLNKNTFNANY